MNEAMTIEQRLEKHDLTQKQLDVVTNRTNLDKDTALDLLIEYVDQGNDADDFEEAFSGKYDSDEDFAEELLTDIGDIPKDLPSYVHIDWTRTAKNIMYDYDTIECNGDTYYFRNL